MKNRQEVRDRLEPYLTQLELGALPADRNAEFNALLADDNAARQYVADYLTTAALIEWSLSRGQEAVFRPTAEDGTSLWRRCGEHAYDFVSNYITLSVIVSALVIANVVLLMAVIVPNADRGNPGVEPPSTEFVARIASTSQAAFDDSSNGNFRNRDLFDDDTIVLNGGLVVIEYDTGARVVLEGPAVYHVQGANGGDLRVGKLTARVETEQAQGFTVEIPHARIVDLGTEFGIEVAEDGGSNVGVIDGKVRLHGLSGA
ncbi:MAG: FecR domain-containing protein, partial [Pirellulales bacterium]